RVGSFLSCCWCWCARSFAGLACSSRKTSERAATAGRNWGPSPPTTPVLDMGAGVEPIGRFGDFELLERLGRDGPFALFRARQSRLDRAVTLKVPVGGAVTLEHGAALWREAAAENSLDHPNIVRVFEAGD